MHLEFAWPWLLLAIPLPLLVMRFLPETTTGSTSAIRFPYAGVIEQIQSTRQTGTLKNLTRLLAILAWLLLVIAACRPQWVGETVQVSVSGRTLMLAVDISGSMAIEDMELNHHQVSRLTAVKNVAGEFIEQRVGDYLGLILFGRNAYLQSPLSFDRSTVRTLLNEAAVGLAGKETAIGDAIGLAVKRLRKQPESNRILILLTDGANTAGAVDPLKAADLAAREGIRIYTIGVGDDQRIVNSFFGARVIGSDLDESTLKAIASKTKGQFFRARDIETLENIYQLLNRIEPAADESQSFRPVRELYTWPLAIAGFLSILVFLSKSREHF